MGHQIYAGDDYRLGVCFTAGAWQVMHWCERFTPRFKPEGLLDRQWADETFGSSEATAESVMAANQHVPLSYEEACAACLVDEDIGPDQFRQCREFLSEAAAKGLSISGSY